MQWARGASIGARVSERNSAVVSAHGKIASALKMRGNNLGTHSQCMYIHVCDLNTLYNKHNNLYYSCIKYMYM